MNILPFRPPRFVITLMAPKTTVTLDTPSKGDFYSLLIHTDTADIMRKYIPSVPLSDTAAELAAEEYIAKIKQYREDNMDYLVIPSETDFGAVEKPQKLPCMTAAEHMVYEYTGLDFAQQNELPVTEYWLLLADAVKYRIMGRSGADEYLEQCYKDMHKISDF